MVYELITNRNMTAGLHTTIIYINDITNGLFINLLLLTFYLIVTLGVYFSQKNSTGFGDFPMASAVGGFSTAIITIILLVGIDGLVNSITSTVVFLVATLCVLWFLFSKD